MKSTAHKAVAIVGVGAILPDAPNAPTYWKNICNKHSSIREVPTDRWSIADYYDPDPNAPDKTYSKIGAWVQGFEFDWKKFRIPPRVVASMDPGQQWAVTIAAEALADYGYPERPLNTEDTAVILGTAMGGELHYLTNLRISFPEYANALKSVTEFKQIPADIQKAILARWHEVIGQQLPPITEDTMPGELANIVSGRVANVLNLRGPNFITDAACASSFAALDAAVELLVENRCDAVLTGGVDRNMGVSSFIKFCKIGALSATGSRPFGEGADGFIMGEGSGAFLLKRLADAEKDGDHIYAVIRGVGGSSDGKGKGITAPNPRGQELAIARAWQNAGLDPATATMVEAHGTSTKVGDVVEVESLAKIFSGAAANSIALGSAKSNIGHLKAGAGAAGLLKATMALHDKVLPPTLNAERTNPNINFAQNPFYVNNKLQEWKQPANSPRRCGVSAYGFGGTNFHIVLEEYVPGALAEERQQFASVAIPSGNGHNNGGTVVSAQATLKTPVRGILAVGAETPVALKDRLDIIYKRVESGWTPPNKTPKLVDLHAQQRLVIDFDTSEELLDRLRKARKIMGFDNPTAWKALQGQGIFRGSGSKSGKIAFLFPGQGSQYLNMGRALAACEPVVANVFAEADKVMTPILGKPLTNFIFVDGNDPNVIKQANMGLMQTAITQPAVLTVDTAIYKLLGEYGLKPDMVMGHSLGEYAALIAADIMPFAHALEASAARGNEMTKVSMDDNGWMAAIFAPYQVVEETLNEIEGYVVAANINSYKQSVIGGASKAVEKAIDLFTKKGFRAVRIPVSHAFHTKIVAPASAPLRKVLDRLDIKEPKLPLVANVTGKPYPTTVEEIKDILEKQIASPVQWVKGLETLYAAGVKTFVEVGPKRALNGFCNDVLGKHPDVVSLFTNHPKTGELPTFNHAICGLYAAGYGIPESKAATVVASAAAKPQAVPYAPAPVMQSPAPAPQPTPLSASTPSGDLGQLFMQALQSINPNQPKTYDRNNVPLGSIVISGTGLGLPGSEKAVMDPDNALRILKGEQFIDLIPERMRNQMAQKHVTRLVKAADGSGKFVTITDPDQVIKLAGRPGSFDLAEEYGVPTKLIEALDMTTQLAMAAGIDALREAGIPLVQTFRKTTTGKYLPQKWVLPESMRDSTGIVFASAFPGYDRMANELDRYYSWQNHQQQLTMLEDLRLYTQDPNTLREVNRRIGELSQQIEDEAYTFDRRFLFRILAMGHSQFAEYIGARGPNTHVNAACASTAQGIGIAEDWIRSGRCQRVLVIGADNVSGDSLMEWIGSGFLASGAAATDDRVSEAALPFDRRRHGTIIGMGACALVVESEDAVRQRGMRGIVELLSSEINNSAFHGTRLDVNHISQVMNNLITSAERRFGLDRYNMAPQTVFVSHETFTPARGGSAAAEVTALRQTFGQVASQIIMANTKGFTGHPMGVGIEDVIAVKILEYGIVPPVPNFKEVDPDLGPLTLSRGGRYPVQYALHLAAGFGSQIALTLTRRIPGGLDRIDNKGLYQRWLADISGYNKAETEVVKRTLRIVSEGVPPRHPAPSTWQYGTGPTTRAFEAGSGVSSDYRPAPMQMPNQQAPATPAPPTPSSAVSPAPETTTTPTPKPELTPPPAPQPPVPTQQPKAAPVTSTTPTADPVVAAPPADPVAPAPPVDPVADKILAIVAEKTGYPSDMLDLDLDMEADLGIDTVKQAETFTAIREAYNIPAREDISLREYPTLSDAVKFVYESRPDLAEKKASQPTQSPTLTVPEAVAPSTATDPVADKILAIVAEKTGYPQDMLDLDLDMEADLGIDTVKQAETFTAIREAYNIPAKEDISLREYPTLSDAVKFVYESRPDLAEKKASQPAPAPTPASMPTAVTPPTAVTTPTVPQTTAADPVADKILAIVADKTGYPEDMLDLDLDMEADLGIDTVKQAETFTAIREAYNIPAKEDISLREYPTLNDAVKFVYENRPDLTQVKQSTAAVPDPAPAPAVAPSPVTIAPTSAPEALVSNPVIEKILTIVAEKTGYPEDMLELDLDMEADLGIDTVKQAETFSAIREAYNIPIREDISLRDYPTLGDAVKFVYQNRPDLPQEITSSAPTPPSPQAPSSEPSNEDDPVIAKILQIVAEKTGYPQDMLELDLDMEADLGIDTVKQAETFSAIREAYDIPLQEDINLRDYPTLTHAVQFVHENRPDLATSGSQAKASTAGPATTASTTAAAPVSATPRTGPTVIGTLEDADTVPRRVPVPALRPDLDLCKATGINLDEGSRVIVVTDNGGIGKSLLNRLEKRGVTTLVIDKALDSEELEAKLKAWLANGPIQGVYWLPALDAEPNIEELDLNLWRTLNHIRVKNLYTTMRVLYDVINNNNTFLVSATRLGGLHGYGDQGATAPLGGSVVGFTKAYKREQNDVLVKVVDFPISRKTAEPADALIAETLYDPGIVEVGYHNGKRYTVTLTIKPAADGQAGMDLNKETVFVVTGAAGGITSAIVTDLAVASGGIFYLLDLVPVPDRDSIYINLFRTDQDALKRKLIDDLKAEGERPTPVKVDQKMMAIEREEAALRAIETVEAAGGTAHYHSVNLLDGPAVAGVINDVRQRYGRIDVLLHAGGLEISRSLPDKPAKQFNLVFDVKADGFFNLLSAAQGLPIKATVSFSSVAGRFGNSGQTDYSAANDLLCKITSSMRTWRPETRGIVIDWTAWGGIGMATRGSIPKIMEMAGIDMLPPEAGVPTIRRELTYGGTRGELVVGLRLGILVKEWDETGGLDTNKVAELLTKRNLLMVGDVKAANLYGGLQIETTFDPQKQPFLFDHQVEDGVPYLPGVMGTEAFAQIATLLTPDYTIAAIEDEQFGTPFKFYRNQPRSLYLSITIAPTDNDELIAKATLKSITKPPRPELPARENTHFNCSIRLSNTTPTAPTIDVPQPDSKANVVKADKIYQVYFHGPAYQVLEQAAIKDNQAIGLMAKNLPPNTEPANVESLMAPRLIELCFQTAGVWDIATNNKMALPMALDSVTTYHQPEQAAGKRLMAVVTALNNGEKFNAQVIDETGTVYVTLQGYRTVALPDKVSF